ncbi:chondroitin sulfate proteoglycan 4-like [Gastrophryne carolinensis]
MAGPDSAAAASPAEPPATGTQEAALSVHMPGQVVPGMPEVCVDIICLFYVCLNVVSSFYGESYVELKTAQLFSKSHLQLRFRTSKADGLLFLAAGIDDYYLVELHEGRVQVKINFENGELVFPFDGGSRLDDSEWHLLKLYHESTNVTLTVDKHIKTKVTADGSNQVDIQHGLYVGGPGKLKVPYLKDMHAYFRGCLENVIFNEYDLLSSLRPFTGLKTVHEVSVGCSDEFFISEEDPISLFSSKSYLAFPRWEMKDEAVWECLFQTSDGRGLLLYHSGKGEDFIAVEIFDWMVSASIRKGKNMAHIDFPNAITENKFHYIKLRITPKHFYLTVEKKTEKTPLLFSLETLGPLYIGGVNDVSRDSLKHFGLKSVSGKHSKGGSLKGCIKNLKVNSVKLGLKNVLATKDISPGCKTDSVLSTNAAMEVKNVLLTTAVPVTSSVSPLVTKKPHKNNFIILSNLVVQEGSKATLQSKHIKLNLNFKELGIRQSQILFQVVEYPHHGTLKFNVSSQQEKGSFTMLDLWHGRITYSHDGSEEPSDQLSFSVTANSKNEMPRFLRGEKLYILNVTVTPSNDVPELSLPEGNLFTLLENSKKQLTGNLIKIYDVDTEPQNLHLIVLGNLNLDAGFLENVKDPGKSITTFSYSDLLEGNIYYVHHGVKNARLVLRVSDGDKVSNTVVLRILAVLLEFQVVNNTGIEVIQGESTLLHSSNLAVETNAVNQDLEIKYDLTEMPKFGQIQRRSSGNEWKPATSFSHRSLERDRIRYLNTYRGMQEPDITESFKFKVTIANKSSEELIFPIKVQWLKYKLLKNVPLDVGNAEKTVFTIDNLSAKVEGNQVEDQDIFFKLESLPTKGRILHKNKELNKNDMFSQNDVIEGNVMYALNSQPREDTQDFFKFLLSTKYAESDLYDFNINIRADLNTIILTNKGLSLGEGETKLLTKDELFVQTLNNRTFLFTVLKSPTHGKLKLINFSTSSTSNDNITVFFTQDILDERLMYAHDSSETVSDAFVILASSVDSDTKNVNLGSTTVQTEFTFNISIDLKNDEKPIRMVDKLFHVVKNGKRLLTLKDLCYHDPDTDFDDGQLVYTRRGIPNGDLVSSQDTSKKLYQFTQDDLKNKRVLYLHQGGEYGRFVLFVTDGKHYTSSLLEVSASEPFINIVNNTGLLVQKGREKAMTPANFSISTNMYVESDSDILYEIGLSPKYGKVYKADLVTDSFTHEDLNNGLIVYKHGDRNQLLDTFNLTVRIDKVSVTAEVKVRIYLESHQRLPTVQNLKNLTVEEGKPVKIDKETLQVVHEDNSPSEIIFTLVSSPIYGYIRRYNSLASQFPNDPKSVAAFTQKDINSGDIQYVQTTGAQLHDTFTLDVTNGVREITGITVFVDIVPIWIPLEVQNITVREGASKALTQEYLHIPSKHFLNVNSEFMLVSPPKHGYIENTRLPGIKMSSFTKKQVEQELIYYVHDDSETLQDNFTVIVNDTELFKQSLPHSIFVSILPTNDEFPVITANNIFRVWVGSVTVVSIDDLFAEDQDNSPADLVYSITPPSNGYLALKSHPNKSILNFTQQHINDGQLVFVHNGAMSGGFNFQVTDGLNFAPRQIFSITARTLVINLEVNKGLGVFPGTRRVISSDVLKAITNDENDMNNRTITFHVTHPPKHGRILKMTEQNMTEVTSFSQSMIDEGMILYEHTDTEALVWSSQDSFIFTVSSPPAMLENQKFFFTVSYETTDPSRLTRLVANNGASVTEGGRILIDKSKLDASNLLARLPESQRSAYEVWYQVTILPKHGVIIVGDRNITKEKPNFSQYIINKFGITYAHDGAEWPVDNFTFATWLNLKSKSAVKPEIDVVEEMFNITVIPVNDQAPELKTKRPSLRVLQGKTVALSPENLNVEDRDNPPEDITYTIISTPNNGFLAKSNHLNETVQKFTQADINNGDLWFVHDGSTSSGVFYFSVTDGKHKPLYKLFNLDVTPVSITLMNNTNLILVQGQNSAPITINNLAASTDGKSTVIHYEISRPPLYGSLLSGDIPVTTFVQMDIELGKIRYHMTNLTTNQDSIEFIIFTLESNLTGQTLNISIEPLISVEPGVKIPDGTKFTLKTSMLNAMELANLTNSDPEYQVVDAPLYGRLLRRLQKEVYEDIERFAQSDLNSGSIMLDVDANVTDQEMVNDSFSFMLSANNVPPALGYFAYFVVPYDPLLINPTTTARTFSSTATSVFSTSLSNERSTTSPFLHRNHTEVPKSRFGNRNRWGNQKPEEPAILPEIANTSSPVRTTTIIKTTIGPKLEASQSSPLSIIIPLVVLAGVMLAIICIVWFLYRKRKAKKAPPHVRSHSYSMVPQVPSPYTERSTTVPTVTVTPLQKPDDFCSVSPILPPRHNHLLTNSAPSLGTSNQNWPQIDPEMAQHCRKTNPTLKTNQYWV